MNRLDTRTLTLWSILFSLVQCSVSFGGQWSIIGNSSVVGIHSALLSPPNPQQQDGNTLKVVLWERFHGLHAPSLYPANPYTFVPSIGQSELTCLCSLHLTNEGRVSSVTCEPKHAPFSTFCAGATQSSDGKLIVVAGDGDNVGNGYIKDGRQAVQMFDPASEQWTFVDNLESTRWYPTVVTLNNR